MPLLDNISGLFIGDLFVFNATSASISFSPFDTRDYIKLFFIVNYTATNSAVTDFQIQESDTIGGYTIVPDTNLIRGTFDDFLIAQGTPFVAPPTIQPPVIGVFGTKRYLNFVWTTTNVGNVGIVLQAVGEPRVKPYLQ